ncbi:MAG: UPF0104 family protein [Actinobacteria bacterium]|nr:MAG: UPF0104 family protein [Actinomycetota bacterium]
MANDEDTRQDHAYQEGEGLQKDHSQEDEGLQKDHSQEDEAPGKGHVHEGEGLEKTVEEVPRTLSGARLARLLALALLLGAAVMVFLLSRSGVEGLRALREVAPLPMALALLAVTTSWVFTAASLVFLAMATQTPRPLRRVFPAFMAGNFVGLVTPFGSGGTPGQAYFLSRLGIAPGTAFALAVARGLISSVLVAGATTIAVAFPTRWLPAGLLGEAARSGLVVVAALLLVATLLAVSNRPAEWSASWAKRSRRPMIRRFWTALSSQTHLFRDALRAVARSPVALAGAVVCEIFAWALMIAVGPLVLIALGWNGPVLALYLRILAMFLVIPVSPTPGSSGTAELAFFLIGRGIVPEGLLPPGVLLWRLLIYYLPVAVGGAFIAWFGVRRARERAAGGGKEAA